MSAPSIIRVPAGQGINSGRFAPTGRAEVEITLDGPADTVSVETAQADAVQTATVPADPAITHNTAMVVAITSLAQDHLAGADGDLYPAFRGYASPLPDDEAAEHWSRLTGAMSQYDRFADPDTGEDAAEEALETADPAVVGDRSLSDYESWNEADLPGESEYIGFDFPRAAEDLTADWDAKVDQAAIDTVTLINGRRISHQAA